LLYDGLVLVESESGGAEAELSETLAKAALARGAGSFAPEGALQRWLARTRFAAQVDPSIAAPTDLEVDAILRECCTGKRSFAELRESFMGAVEARLEARARSRVVALAPDRVTLAGGRAATIHYAPNGPPSVASRLQDFFGMLEGPTVAGGKVALVMHLLAPNQRAVQVTSDLSGFWSKHYPAIRSELARKYPRHSWPEDPRRPTPPMRPRTKRA
jgi:ATP-dependent helicase HrpB